MTKVKESILKAAREKDLVTGEPPKGYQLISLQKLYRLVGMAWYIQSTEGQSLQPRMLFLARLSFGIEGELKNFSKKQKLKEFSNTKPTLKEILKGLLQIVKKQEVIGKGKSQ